MSNDRREIDAFILTETRAPIMALPSTSRENRLRDRLEQVAGANGLLPPRPQFLLLTQ